MNRFARARMLSGGCAIVMWLASVAWSNAVLAGPPAAKTFPPAVARQSAPSARMVADTVPVNPLRTPAVQPAEASGSSAAAIPQPFVPNTGRLRLFRAAEKPLNSTQSSLGLRVMRYEDVARGAALVPVTPPSKAVAKAVVPVPVKPPGTSAAPAQQRAAAPELQIQRLPPVERVTRPQLPPGTKLPQQPIVIYPETGKY